MTPAELIASAGIQRNYGYQILDGRRHPARDKVLSLCLALTLDVTETQRALTLTQNGQLYSKNRRDSILIFALEKKAVRYRYQCAPGRNERAASLLNLFVLYPHHRKSLRRCCRSRRIAVFCRKNVFYLLRPALSCSDLD